MKINLTKLLDVETRIVRLIDSSPDERDTTDASWYVNRLEETSPNQSYSFVIEGENLMNF